MPITPIDENIEYVYIVAGCVVEKDGKYLLVQEKQKKYYQLWNLPAGKVEKGKSIEETAVRETKEETGIEVEITGKIGTFMNQGEEAVKHAFQAKQISGEIQFPKDEILDVQWYNLEEIEKMDKEQKLRENWVIEAIKSSK